LAIPPAGSAGGTTDFSAFLLGLRAAARPAGATVEPVVEGGTTPAATAFDTLPILPASAVPVTALAGDAPADAVVSGSDSGTDLPADGTELPLAELEQLLVTLNMGGPATVPTAETTAAALPAVPTAAAGTSPAPGEVPTPATASDRPAGAESGARGAPQASGRAEVAQPELTGSATDPGDRTPQAVNANAGVPDTSGLDTAASADLALPPDFRARLEALLTPASAATAGSEPAGGAWTAMTASATLASAAPTGGPAAQPSGTTPFDMLPALRPLADGEAWSQGLGERLLLMAERGLQSATIRLQPEQLGPMEIRIEVDGDGAAQVLFSAHHAQTREALENAIPRLRELFADQGLTLTQANVDSGRGTFAQREFASPASAWRAWAAADADAPALAAERAWQVTRSSHRRVDVFV
jgi:flagellar hook-length control protein FliK